MVIVTAEIDVGTTEAERDFEALSLWFLTPSIHVPVTAGATEWQVTNGVKDAVL